MNKHRFAKNKLTFIPRAFSRLLFLCALLRKQGILYGSMAPVCFLLWHCPSQDPQSSPLL